jgi:hypothetical protein
MLKIMMITTLATTLFFSGCGSDTDPKEALEHDSVLITELSTPIPKIITYDNNGAAHSYKYCPNGKLLYGEDLNDIGTYTINGNNVEITEAINLVYETNGKFEKGKKYNVTPTAQQEQVTKIVATICGEVK